MFFLLILFMTLGTGLLWFRADRRARGRPGGRVIRLLLGIFFLPVVTYPPLIASRFLLAREPDIAPDIVVTAAYLWHPIILPLTLIAVGTAAVLSWIFRRRRPLKIVTPPMLLESAAKVVENGWTRRSALGLAASALPPFFTISLTAASIAQRGQFRIRRLDLALPALPADLDGVTLVQVSDLHCGNFFPRDATLRVTEAVNALKADLVVFTGDLIDRGLLDRLHLGRDFTDNLDRRHGFVMIEGNHDVQEDALSFERAMIEQGLPFLVEGEKQVRLPGRSTPVQFLGIPWGRLHTEDEDKVADGSPRTLRWGSEQFLAESVVRVAALREPKAFPILLAHHPHAFDAAAAAGLPLVLSGHTHGGQLMLTDGLGAGPLRFRYWSGVHAIADSRLVISNGLGGWFPLRVNAPAEVLHITLRKSAT